MKLKSSLDLTALKKADLELRRKFHRAIVAVSNLGLNDGGKTLDYLKTEYDRQSKELLPVTTPTEPALETNSPI